MFLLQGTNRLFLDQSVGGSLRLQDSGSGNSRTFIPVASLLVRPSAAIEFPSNLSLNLNATFLIGILVILWICLFITVQDWVVWISALESSSARVNFVKIPRDPWTDRKTVLPGETILMVVQIQAILFLKSMSERFGSDIQRLWNWILNFLIDKIDWKWRHSKSESFYVGSDSFRHWF